MEEEEDEIEESIKEDLEHSDKKNDHHHKNKSDLPTPVMYKDGNPFSSKANTNFKMNATPNTILSNKQKLNRGISRDSE